MGKVRKMFSRLFKAIRDRFAKGKKSSKVESSPTPTYVICKGNRMTERFGFHEDDLSSYDDSFFDDEEFSDYDSILDEIKENLDDSDSDESEDDDDNVEYIDDVDDDESEDDDDFKEELWDCFLIDYDYDDVNVEDEFLD